MPGFTKLSILEAFIEKEDHKISWLDLAKLYNVIDGTERATLLGNIIRELEDERIIERLALPIAWEIIDINEAIQERDRLI